MHQTLSSRILIGALVLLIGYAHAAPPTLDLSSRLEAEFALQRATSRLLELQSKDGTWSRHPGISALVVIALQKTTGPGDEPSRQAIAAALPAMRQFADAAPDMVNRDTTHVYSCAATHLALLSVSTDPADLARAKALAAYLEEFLRRRLGSANLMATGGVVDMPDVSNLHWAIDSVLLARGRDLPLDLTNQIRRFLESCQASSGKDAGGFAYAPFRDDSNRPIWGSLTWAAIRALLLTGYQPDDPVIANGRDWLRQNFTVDANPGLKRGGYYYYLYLAAGTNLLHEQLEAAPIPTNWRQLLVDHLLSSQNGDGSWTNSSPIWLENRKPLATAYAALVLAMTLQ